MGPALVVVRDVLLEHAAQVWVVTGHLSDEFALVES